MLEFICLAGSTFVLVAWGVIDWRGKDRLDAAFLWALALFDGGAATKSWFEMSALEERMAPRRFTADQTAKFQNVILHGKGDHQAPEPVVVRFNASDVGRDREEEAAFARDLTAAIAGAGWHATLDEKGEFGAGNGISFYRVGVLIICEKNKPLPALHLTTAFKIAGLLVDFEYGEQDNAIQLIVFHRPPG